MARKTILRRQGLFDGAYVETLDGEASLHRCTSSKEAEGNWVITDFTLQTSVLLALLGIFDSSISR